MAVENTLQYVNVEFLSHRDALLQRVRARWGAVWNDFTANSLGMMFVDLMAWSTATMAFMINRAAAENFVTTMTLRESAVRIGALVGYRLRGTVAASVLCEASLASPATARVLIAKGTVVRAGPRSLPFEVAQDYFVEVGYRSPETLVATLSADLSGSKTLSTSVAVTTGSTVVQAVDRTIDLRRYVSSGQTFSVLPDAGDATVYTVQAVEPGSGSGYDRLVISPAYAGPTNAAVSAKIVDRRILLAQGQTVVDRFVTLSLETKGYSVKLSRGPIIDGSVSVTINGEAWEAVADTAVQAPGAAVFCVRTLPSGTTLAEFGDGRFGRTVPTDAAVVVTYRVGGGEDGNLPAGSFSTSIAGTLGGSANTVMVALTNLTAAGQGGRGQETVEEARAGIPFYVKTNDRAVTLDDWQTLAQRFTDPRLGSVAYARASVRTENSLLEGNMVVIYAWMTGAGGILSPLSPALKAALRDYLRTKAVGTDFVEVFDGSARPAPLSLRFRTYDGADPVETLVRVQGKMREFVAAARPGASLIFSDFVREIDQLTGVDSVQMATPSANLVASNPMELFTPPESDYDYVLPLVESGAYMTAQSPVTPLRAWSFTAVLGGTELLVLPHSTPGYARLVGPGLSLDSRPDFVSTVNLLTGQVRLRVVGAPVSLRLRLIPAQGYARERAVDIFIGYTGISTPEKRAEIRSALRAWAAEIGIGAPLYAREISGLPASLSSVTAVVAAVPGVVSVTRVALGTPANNDSRLLAADNELLGCGAIALNNRTD